MVQILKPEPYATYQTFSNLMTGVMLPREFSIKQSLKMFQLGCCYFYGPVTIKCYSIFTV